jgi:hypothetical protein
MYMSTCKAEENFWNLKKLVELTRFIPYWRPITTSQGDPGPPPPPPPPVKSKARGVRGGGRHQDSLAKRRETGKRGRGEEGGGKEKRKNIFDTSCFQLYNE